MTPLDVMDRKQRELFELGRAAALRQPSVNGTHLVLTGQIEWYTPPQYIDAARSVMGTIDCDPASSILAQKVVQATTYYTIEDDGLRNPWHGTVWLNPPYAASIIGKFVNRLVASLESGEVSQAIMLTHCNSDTKWYHHAWAHCAAFCQTRGRVRFYSADGTANSPTHGHVFLYFGKRLRRFADVFKQFGAVSVPYTR